MRGSRSLLLALCGCGLIASPAAAATTYTAEDLSQLAQISTQGGVLGRDISNAAADVGGGDPNASRCLDSLADDAIGVAEATAGLEALVSVDVEMLNARDDASAAHVIGTELDSLEKTVDNRRQAANRLEARCGIPAVSARQQDLANYLDSVDQEIGALRAKLTP